MAKPETESKKAQKKMTKPKKGAVKKSGTMPAGFAAMFGGKKKGANIKNAPKVGSKKKGKK